MDMETYKLIQITAPHFCAGAVIKNGKVVITAPIIKWMIGKNKEFITNYCKKKKWKIREV